jgi:hypothetical protein
MDPEQDQEFFRGCYGTLLMALLLIAATAAAFYYLYRFYFPPSTLQPQLAALFGVLTAVTAFLTYDFQGGRAWGDDLFGVTPLWKKRLLPVAVIAVLTLLGLVCALTGGSISSPFSHYLTAIGGLAIVFARETRTRLSIAGASVIVFYLSGRYYFPICTSELQAGCSSSVVLTDGMLWFHTACVVVVSALAIKAIASAAPQLTPARRVQPERSV